MAMKEIGLVYMVAGLSARFGGKNKSFAAVGPKGETLIEYSLACALKSKFTRIVFIVGNATEHAFREKFGSNYNGIPVLYAKQTYDEKERDRPWGATDAITSAKEIINFPFVVCNGDDIYGEETFRALYNHLAETETENATVGYFLRNVLPAKGSCNRAIISVDDSGYMSDIDEIFGIEREKIADKGLNEGNLCSMNIFAFVPEVLAPLHSKVEDFKERNRADRKAEYPLPVALSELLREKRVRIRLYGTSSRCPGVSWTGDEIIVREELEMGGL